MHRNNYSDLILDVKNILNTSARPIRFHLPFIFPFNGSPYHIPYQILALLASVLPLITLHLLTPPSPSPLPPLYFLHCLLSPITCLPLSPKSTHLAFSAHHHPPTSVHKSPNGPRVTSYLLRFIAAV